MNIVDYVIIGIIGKAMDDLLRWQRKRLISWM